MMPSWSSRDAEFLLRADHRVRLDAADLGALERRELQTLGVAVVECGAFFGIGHLERLGQLALPFEVEDVGRAG